MVLARRPVMPRVPLSSALAAAAGAALATCYFDRQQGAARRARVRDQIYSRLSHLDAATRVGLVDTRNRLRGTFGTLRTRITGRHVDDEVLSERVRAKLGRFVAHPHSVEVAASSGVVTVSGPILAHEHKALRRAIGSVPGVRKVIDRLEVHKQAGDVPGLQGGRRREQRLDIAQEHWAPATRIGVGLAGAALAYFGLARRSALTPLLLLGGAGLLTRAGTNMDTRRILGLRGRLGIDFIKTITIAAPVDQVFALWRDFENFPKFMRNVRRVSKTGDGNWHWEVAGPLGVAVRWNASVTQLVPNEVIAWSTTLDSPVQHAGMVKFQEENGGTRIQVEMSYKPPAGAFGHAVASIFGAEPSKEMGEDLMRMKSLFETGKAPRDAAQAERSVGPS